MRLLLDFKNATAEITCFSVTFVKPPVLKLHSISPTAGPFPLNPLLTFYCHTTEFLRHSGVQKNTPPPPRIIQYFEARCFLTKEVLQCIKQFRKTKLIQSNKGPLQTFSALLCIPSSCFRFTPVIYGCIYLALHSFFKYCNSFRLFVPIRSPPIVHCWVCATSPTRSPESRYGENYDLKMLRKSNQPRNL